MVPPSFNEDYSSRAAHQVESPDSYQTWREYAFSETPELVGDGVADATPVEGIPTV
jgi:hypothetical protein